jgi:adenylate kinase
MSGEEAKEVDFYMEKGDLVPDDIVIKTITNFLTRNNLYEYLILDGSPRSLYQYEKLKDFFTSHGKKINKAINIKISDEVALQRLTARRENLKTGEIYNLITKPPGKEVKESDLIQREDDKEEAVKERLRVQKVPQDLISGLKNDGILVEIDGERPIEVIFEDILKKLKEKNE